VNAENQKRDAYDRLGVRKLINAEGTVIVRRVFPTGPSRRPDSVPRAYVQWDADTARFTIQELVHALYNGDPPIAVGSADEALVLNPQTLDPGEEKIIADRLASY